MEVESQAITVCVPASIQNDKQLNFVQFLIANFNLQTKENKELVISDDSRSGELRALCEMARLQGIKVRYFESSIKGIAANLNNAIRCAITPFIKIMFQDDFFFRNDVLEHVVNELESSDCLWYVSACNHYNELTGECYEAFFPRKSNRLLLGNNSISSPSVVSFKREAFEPFSERLTYLVDCEWYLRMSHKHGLPIFGNRIEVSNRIHDSQATHWAKAYLESEIVLSKMMHSSTKMGQRACLCL